MPTRILENFKKKSVFSCLDAYKRKTENEQKVGSMLVFLGKMFSDHFGQTTPIEPETT